MQIIDGKKISAEIREELKSDVATLDGKVGLAVILVGDDDASKIYVRNKMRACAEIGIQSYLVELPKTVKQEEVLENIYALNENPDVNGIILQLPVPDHLDEAQLLDSISPIKDADGCHFVQKGLLWTGRPSVYPCTPHGCIALLKRYGVKIEGKKAVVVGRSNLVGKPLAQMLLDENATVTICHSKTENLGEITKSADILCVATGHAKLITADMVKDGAVVVDVGINRDENGKLCGDVDFENVAPKCSFITPVPGGVGPMTVTMLMNNAVGLFKEQQALKAIQEKK